MTCKKKEKVRKFFFILLPLQDRTKCFFFQIWSVWAVFFFFGVRASLNNSHMWNTLKNVKVIEIRNAVIPCSLYNVYFTCYIIQRKCHNKIYTIKSQTWERCFENSKTEFSSPPSPRAIVVIIIREFCVIEIWDFSYVPHSVYCLFKIDTLALLIFFVFSQPIEPPNNNDNTQWHSVCKCCRC